MAIRLPPSGDTGEESYAPLAEINVTPMVDVMLVLLVIFMVAAPLLTVGVPINLPKTSAAQVTEPQQPLVVSINKAGETFIGDDKVIGDDLKTRLGELATQDPTPHRLCPRRPGHRIRDADGSAGRGEQCRVRQGFTARRGRSHAEATAIAPRAVAARELG